MHSNYAFYFGATPENTDQLSKLKNLKDAVGSKLFAGSSTGNLLVDKEADIEKVISKADRIVSIHSEDEEILNIRKKFIKKETFVHILSGEIVRQQCHQRVELSKLQRDIIKRFMCYT